MSSFSIVAESAGRYLHWGVFLISVTNFLIIVAMVLLFILALLLPFGSRQDQGAEQERREQ
jgi:large-conductance mechanosensitive channel